MLLNEFFGRLNIKNDKPSAKEEENDKLRETQMLEDVLEYIINDDTLHKKVFFPIAEEIGSKPTAEHGCDVWMPLANKSCMKFYHKFGLQEDPLTLFTKEFRESLCTRIAEHYNGDILKGIYKLGK
jgi:hypothetical protein